MSNAPITVNGLSSTADLTRTLAPYVDQLCIVMFTASWCGPCKVLKSRIHYPGRGSISEDNPRVQFVYVDVEDNPQLAAEWAIASIPHMFYTRPTNAGLVVFGNTRGGNDDLVKERIREYQTAHFNTLA